MYIFVSCKRVEGCLRKMLLKKTHVETSNKSGLDFFHFD